MPSDDNELATIARLQTLMSEAMAQANAKIDRLQREQDRLDARCQLLESCLNQHTALVDQLRAGMVGDDIGAIRRALDAYVSGAGRLAVEVMAGQA